ncbi:MAG: response regulator transcription factor [Chloroflexi bacterium]|nr:response regulator transcription factor [Chloroflexota bacterium]
MENIKVLLVDDHALLRQGIRSVVSLSGDIEVVGEAEDGVDAYEKVKSLGPDVVITDVKLPTMDGLELARRIRLNFPKAAVVVLTAYDDEEQLFNAIKVGAAAYCTKDVSGDDLMVIVRRVFQGEYLINESVLTKPKVASRVLKQFRDLSLVGQDVEPLFVPLSNREIEILDYIAKGNSNKQIARELKISDQTVKNHITSILRKLAVNDRTEAVVFALRRGWIKMD